MRLKCLDAKLKGWKSQFRESLWLNKVGVRSLDSPYTGRYRVSNVTML